MGEIKKVIVSAYKAGYFNNAVGGVPHWIVDETKGFQEATFESSSKIYDVTVFILPNKINGLTMYGDNNTLIDDASENYSSRNIRLKQERYIISRYQKEYRRIQIAVL